MAGTFAFCLSLEFRDCEERGEDALEAGGEEPATEGLIACAMPISA